MRASQEIEIAPDDEEPDVQVHGVDGLWHRLLPGMRRTACGAAHSARFHWPRPHRLRHPLCPTCHTPLELALADKAQFEDEEGAL